MKSLVCTQPGVLEYQEAPPPALQREHAIIKVRNIGVCGTDLHAFTGTQPYFDYPRVLGHELSGELVDFDSAPGFARGDAVTFLPYLNCQHCIACRMGKPNCCVNLQVFGVHRDGGMADYISVPSRLLVHGCGLSYKHLALVEPLAIGAHGIRRTHIQPGLFLAVVGAGPIGLGAMAFARIAGAEVIAMDIDNNRLTFSKTHIGVAHTINTRTENAVEKLCDITHGERAAIVMDATGNLAAINNGLAYVAHGGEYVLIGLQKEAFQFSHPEFHKRETTLMSSRNATRDDFETVMAAMQKGLVQPDAFINNTVLFCEVKAQFASWLSPASGIIKTTIETE